MTVSQVKDSLGPTSLAEEARLAGGFADWNNLVRRVYWITGPLDLGAVQETWRRVCLRHDALRRTYVSPDEACTHEDALSEVQVLTAETDENAISVMRDFLGRPFDLDGPTFTRVAIVTRGEQRHLFGVALDHIITDLISWRQIREDFGAIYDRVLSGADDGLPPAGSYQDFASEQRRLLSGRWGDDRKAFWRSYVDEFGGYPPPLLASPEHTGGFRQEVAKRSLPADVKAKVDAYARQSRVTPFAIVATGTLHGVRAVSDDSSAGVSVTHHGRGLAGTARTAGLFAETVPLHLGRVSASPLAMVQDVFFRALDVFEYAMPLGFADRYWDLCLSADRGAPGLQVELHHEPITFYSHSDGPYFTPLFPGLGSDWVELALPGDALWPETVLVDWNLFDTDPHISAEYNSNYYPDAVVDELLTTAEQFVLSLSG